jgi:hypothetical protein
MIDFLQAFAGHLVGILALVVPAITTWQYRKDMKRERENIVRDTKLAAMEREYRMFLAALPLTYVVKDDYRRDLDELKGLMREVRDEVKEIRNPH